MASLSIEGVKARGQSVNLGIFFLFLSELINPNLFKK
jgi:hypothetical protein